MVSQYTHKPPYRNQRTEIIPPKIPSFIGHPKNSHLYLQTTIFTSLIPQTPLNAMTCKEPEKTPINLSEGKSACVFIFEAKPLGDTHV